MNKTKLINTIPVQYEVLTQSSNTPGVIHSVAVWWWSTCGYRPFRNHPETTNNKRGRGVDISHALFVLSAVPESWLAITPTACDQARPGPTRPGPTLGFRQPQRSSSPAPPAGRPTHNPPRGAARRVTERDHDGGSSCTRSDSTAGKRSQSFNGKGPLSSRFPLPLAGLSSGGSGVQGAGRMRGEWKAVRGVVPQTWGFIKFSTQECPELYSPHLIPACPTSLVFIQAWRDLHVSLRRHIRFKCISFSLVIAVVLPFP